MSSGNPDVTKVGICTECGLDIPPGIIDCPHEPSLSMTKAEEMLGLMLAEHYRIDSLVGMGGMSVVYKARDVILDRVVAIKLMHSHLVALSGSLKRFEQEAKAVSHLAHPNIVAVHKYGVSQQGQPYLIMDYLDGMSLGELLKQAQRLPVDRSMDIFIQICAALEHAHQKGIIHRDLKPSNVMLVEMDSHPDFVKIVDFGLAKLLPSSEVEGQRLTQTGEVFGSPMYMSPEQCMGQKLDERSDIFSMGCIMYETLTGNPPYVGNNIMETMYMRLTEKASAFNPELHISKQIETIVLITLAQDPTERYQSMGELRRDLELTVQGVDRGSSLKLRALRSQSKRKGLLKGGQGPTAEVLFVAVALMLLIAGVTVWLEFSKGSANQLEAAAAAENSWRKYDQDGQKLLDQGKYEEAARVLAKAVSEAEKFGEQDQRLSISLKKQSALYRATGRTLEADSLDERISMLKEQNKYGDSESNLEELADLTLDLVPKTIEKGKWAEYHTLTEKLNHLAVLCINKKFYDKAEELLLQALEIENTSLGNDNLNVARTLNSLAILYSSKEGRYQLAEPLFNRVLKIRTKALGPSHPEVASTLYHLARLYEEQGKFAQAEDLYKQSLQIFERVLGPGDPQVAMAVTGLGGLYRRQSKDVLAESLFKRALSIYEKSGGPRDVNVGMSLNNLAGLAYGQGKYNEAAPLYERALEIMEKTQGSEAPGVATIENNLAVVYYKQGHFEKAEPLLRRALAIRERVLPPEHPEIAQSMNTLAELYRQQHKYDQAAPLYEKALSITQGSLGADHPETAIVLSSIGQLNFDRGAYSKAESFYRRALKIRQNSFGAEHPQIADSLSSLGQANCAQRKYSEAEGFFKAALSMREKALGSSHPDVSKARDDYADLLFKTNRFTDALNQKLATLSIQANSWLRWK